MTLPPVAEGHDRVVIDFDGVLAENNWPSPVVGSPIKEGIELLKAFVDEGKEVIVYTARPHSHQQRIWSWLAMQGLQMKVYDVVTGKPTAGVYVDDRAWRFER